MPRQQLSHGLELVASEARKNGLALGSRAVDGRREVVRLSFEKVLESKGRGQLRTPTFEFSQEFIEDLPADKGHQQALAIFLNSLALRLVQPKPQQFLTLSGVPIELDIKWPFRPVQTSLDQFVHVHVHIGCPWSHEAHFTVAISGSDELALGIHSLSPPNTEWRVINAIRTAIDERRAAFYRLGTHPETLQRVSIEDVTQQPIPPDRVRSFLKRKVYWLGYREGDDSTAISIADPYDAIYLGLDASRLRQVAGIANANSELHLDSSKMFACATDALLREVDAYDNELADIISGAPPYDTQSARKDTAEPRVFISHSKEDSAFARFLHRALASRNIRVWLDEKELCVGESLTNRIGNALRENDFIVVVLSPASVRSQWVRIELAEALARELREKRVVVLPVIHRSCSIPAFLTDKKYADFTTGSDYALELLVRSIKQHHASVPERS